MSAEELDEVMIRAAMLALSEADDDTPLGEIRARAFEIMAEARAVQVSE